MSKELDDVLYSDLITVCQCLVVCYTTVGTYASIKHGLVDLEDDRRKFLVVSRQYQCSAKRLLYVRCIAGSMHGVIHTYRFWADTATTHLILGRTRLGSSTQPFYRRRHTSFVLFLTSTSCFSPPGHLKRAFSITYLPRLWICPGSIGDADNILLVSFGWVPYGGKGCYYSTIWYKAKNFSVLLIALASLYTKRITKCV
ncbi:hypothetical protein BDQ17DRAFT_687855 [Cyathus striatus]|nr:hypothetical protein BDQ17DRAFT_687855 [Cyathus striatus]